MTVRSPYCETETVCRLGNPLSPRLVAAASLRPSAMSDFALEGEARAKLLLARMVLTPITSVILVLTSIFFLARLSGKLSGCRLSRIRFFRLCAGMCSNLF